MATKRIPLTEVYYTHQGLNVSRLPLKAGYLRNESWKPECVGNFNMDWPILVFYPDPEARDKIY